MILYVFTDKWNKTVPCANVLTVCCYSGFYASSVCHSLTKENSLAPDQVGGYSPIFCCCSCKDINYYFFFYNYMGDSFSYFKNYLKNNN